MQKIPQIVSQRLKAGATVGGHPDPDVLTALAEHSLPERERSRVLTHLAACGDCREIVALALPPIESMANAPSRVQKSWLTWPAFRWGFAAAGVAVIALGAVEFERRQPTHSEIVARQAASAPVPAAAPDQNLSQTKTTPPTALPHPAFAANVKLAKKDVRAPSQGNMSLDGASESRDKSIVRLQAPTTALTAKQVPANSPPPPAVSEMVEVQAQSPTVETESSAQGMAALSGNRPAEQLFDYKSGPLSRAKPANIAPPLGSARALVTATWSITAVGGLQKSLDQGRSWQDVTVDAAEVPAPSASGASIGGGVKTTAKQSSIHGQALKISGPSVFFRAVTASANEVWAGGSNTALFHSVDGGDHWTRVLPSSSGAVLTGDVVSVEFSDPQHGTVTTSTPEVWITSDGGQNWRKQ